MRYFLQLSFDGSAFHGWQNQLHVQSVQQCLEEKLSTLLHTKTNIVGCGRTDAGVHASDYFAHFDCHYDLSNPLQADAAIVQNKEVILLSQEEILFRLNHMLPAGIAVHRIIRVADHHHARFDASERSYHYYIHRRKDPFLIHYSYEYCYAQLDLVKMQSACKILGEMRDFKFLSKPNEDNKTTLCEVKEIYLEELNDYQWRLVFTANRFLHNMVRRTVGLLIMIGREKISLDELKKIVYETADFKLKTLAPPNGLRLVKVRYPGIPELGRDE